MIRLSVTWLDQYAYFKQSEDMTEQELAERLFGPYQPTPEMQAGTALHAILENASEHDDLSDLLSAGRDGWRYILSESISGEVQLGLSREEKHVITIMPGVNLVGKIDAITATEVIDHKLTGSFDPERYMESFQWKAYLTMLNRERFAYQVFERDKIEQDENGYVVRIKDYHRLTMSRYPGIGNEVRDICRELAEFFEKWRPQYADVRAA